MFKRSLTFLLCVFITVLGMGFYTQWQGMQRLPSRYDSGLKIHKAFKTSKVPLLVEFYSDQCGNCQRITPNVHTVAEHLKGKVTLVMVNVADPESAPIAQLFGVTEIPRVYVFDFHHMKKRPITQLESERLLEAQVTKIL